MILLSLPISPKSVLLSAPKCWKSEDERKTGASHKLISFFPLSQQWDCYALVVCIIECGGLFYKVGEQNQSSLSSTNWFHVNSMPLPLKTNSTSLLQVWYGDKFSVVQVVYPVTLQWEANQTQGILALSKAVKAILATACSFIRF